MATNSERKRPKVLLVDDDIDQVELYKIILERWGYDVTGVDDADEALVRAECTPFELVICDLMMPRISGAEFITRLRNVPGCERTRVMLLTAGGSSSEDFHSVPFRADAFCLKGSETTLLRSKLEALLTQ